MSEQATAEWRGMESGRALDRVVAERLGWRVEHLETIEYTDPKSKSVAWYAIFDPSGEPMIREAGYSYVNEWPDYDMEDVWPAFSTDANAALALLLPHWTVMVARIENDVWHCGINSISSRASDHGDGQADTPAMAIVRAYLNWSDKQQ